MPTVLRELAHAFTDYAIKVVSKTDKEKAAYVVNKNQCRVLSAAGYEPGTVGKLTLVPFIEPITGEKYLSSYYESLREGAGRVPEARMGQGIVSFMNIGDTLLIGTDGANVYLRKILKADKIEKTPEEIDRVKEDLYSKLDRKRLFELAKNGPKIPLRKSVNIDQFVRNPAVKAYVTRRCAGKCEVPGCKWIGFEKDDGSRFIEVHHIKPLGENGEDTILNTIGICPNCHAEAHYSKGREHFAGEWLKAVRKLTDQFESHS